MLRTILMAACLLLLLLASNMVSAQNNLLCRVPFDYENKPLSEVLDTWSGWCKMDIVYDKDAVANTIISGKHEMLFVKNALDLLLQDTEFTWKSEGAVVEIVKYTDVVDFVKISSKVENTTLEKVLNSWKSKYKLEIKHNKQDIQGFKVSSDIVDEPLDIAFAKLLKDTPLEFKIIGEKRVFLALSSGKSVDIQNIKSVAQNITISGILKDQDSGESLPFANVLVKGTSIGTTTNLDGYFTLSNVPSDTSTLKVSYIGYLNKEYQLLPVYALNELVIYLNSGATELEGVVITAQKKEQILKQTGISKIAMTPEIAGILPSTGEKDIFRSLQLLPGISGSNESSSGLYVRGGTPDQNLIMLDGFTVYHVDHLYGFFSAFNSNAIKDLQLYKGGFEPKFGGRLSSVVDITAKDGNSEQFNAGINLSFLSINAFVESPFAQGKGSFIVTGRRSYQSGLYNKIFDSFAGTQENDFPELPAGPLGRFAQAQVQPTSYFYDLNAKVAYRLSNKDKITLSFYNGEDDLDNSRIIDNNSTGGGLFGGGGNFNFNFLNDNIDVSNWGNVGTSMKWSRKWSDKFFTNSVVSYSNYFSVRDQSEESTITREDTTIVRSTGSYESNDLKDYSFRIDAEYNLSPNNKLDFGLQMTNNDIEYNYTQNDTLTLIDRSNIGTTSAFYLQDRITIGNKLVLKGGLRANHYSLTDKFYIEPRASFTYLLGDAIKLKGAYGQYNQFATRVVREDIQQGSRDFWILADDDLIPTAKSTHYIVGFSYDHKNWLFDVELFQKDYEGLSEYTTRFTSSGFGPQQTLELDEQFFTGTGVAKGAEFLLQKKLGKVSGWLGYTWSEVKYDFPDFGAAPFYANQDTRQEFKAVASYRVKDFDISSTFVYATGRPYTAPVGFYEITFLDDNVEPYFQVSDKNVLRYPSYHRLDLSANYNFKIKDGPAKIGLSIFNVYGRKNTWYREYDVIEGELLETDISLLGFTPSLFLNWSLR